MPRRVKLHGVRTDILQTLRLTHAIAEAGVPLAVAPSMAPAWRWLDRYFDGLDWKATKLGRRFADVDVDHHAPRTRAGGIERPLLFPHGILDRCWEMWGDRSERIVFAGLMTPDRERTLASLTDAFGDAFSVLATEAGRVWPSKAWDDGYYRSLANAQLAACPNGDFVWTYRFFEAAMCGAIPVIEDKCEHYDGFLYYRMADEPEAMRWRADWAEHNATLVRERLTAPHEDLTAAVRAS